MLKLPIDEMAVPSHNRPFFARDAVAVGSLLWAILPSSGLLVPMIRRVIAASLVDNTNAGKKSSSILAVAAGTDWVLLISAALQNLEAFAALSALKTIKGHTNPFPSVLGSRQFPLSTCTTEVRQFTRAVPPAFARSIPSAEAVSTHEALGLGNHRTDLDALERTDRLDRSKRRDVE